MPLLYVPDGERFVVVGSNGGDDRPPAWWLNLQKQPAAQVQVGRRRHPRQRASGERRGARRAVEAARGLLLVLCRLPPPDFARDPGGGPGAQGGLASAAKRRAQRAEGERSRKGGLRFHNTSRVVPWIALLAARYRASISPASSIWPPRSTRTRASTPRSCAGATARSAASSARARATPARGSRSGSTRAAHRDPRPASAHAPRSACCARCSPARAPRSVPRPRLRCSPTTARGP
jgi:hypothetical protein